MKTSKKCVYLLALLFLSTIPGGGGPHLPWWMLPSFPMLGAQQGEARQGSHATGQEDLLGLRERLLIAKPAHASRLPPCMTILQSAFGLCMSCITPITHQSNAVFDLNYKWVQYSCSDAAAELVWENFDDRAVEQEAAYKTHHQAANRV